MCPLGGRPAAVRAVCKDLGAGVEVVVTDVLDDAQVERAVVAALARFGRLDVCVHVAGVSAYGHHTGTTADVFARVVSINLVGAANVARSNLWSCSAPKVWGHLWWSGQSWAGSRYPVWAPTWPPSGEDCGCCSRRTGTWPGSGSRRWHRARCGPPSTAAPSGAATTAPHHRRPPLPRTVARTIGAAAQRRPRENDVDAFGGLGNKVLATAFIVAPGVFDRLVGPLMRTLNTPTARPGVDSGQLAGGGPR